MDFKNVGLIKIGGEYVTKIQCGDDVLWRELTPEEVETPSGNYDSRYFSNNEVIFYVRGISLSRIQSVVLCRQDKDSDTFLSEHEMNYVSTSGRGMLIEHEYHADGKIDNCYKLRIIVTYTRLNGSTGAIHFLTDYD